MTKEEQINFALEEIKKCIKSGFYGNLRFNFKDGILINANKEESIKM
jgi:hypothetical protein